MAAYKNTVVTSKKYFKVLTETEASTRIPKRTTANTRNALSDLSDNIPLAAKKPAARKTILNGNENLLAVPGSKTTKRIKSVTNEVVTVRNDVVRSKSSSKIEEKLYCFKSTNVTDRKKDDEGDEVFVNGVEHYINYVATKTEENYLSKKQVEKAESKVVRAVPAMPAKKVTLAKRISHKPTRKEDTTTLYSNPMYDSKYYLDNLQYMLHNEDEYVYRYSCLKKSVDEPHRTALINWLIYAQQNLELADSTLFVAIRMFDNVLIVLKVPPKIYVLTGITCMWIANKLIDSRYLEISKLFALCRERYSKDQFVEKEREILKALNFNLNYSEPTAFLFYYLDYINLKADATIRNCAMFMMECFTLVIHFSSIAPSILAASALYSVLLKFDMDTDLHVKFVSQYVVDKESLIGFKNQMQQIVNEMLRCKSASTEVVAKYTSPIRSSVVKLFSN